MSTKQKEQAFREALSEAKTPKEIREAVMQLPDYKPSAMEHPTTSKHSKSDTKKDTTTDG
jgi:hypothetical protein